MMLDALAGEPCLSLAWRGSGIEASGATHCFRGHSIRAAEGDRPDGIFSEWTWNGRTLVVRNDRYGALPIFYWHDGNRLVVSPSIVKVIEAGAPTDIDGPALALYLRLGFFVGDDTPFRAIRIVPPAATFTWDNGALSVSGGYRLPPPRRVTRDAAIDGFVDLFRAAIRRRPPRAPTVLPLSGGRDSRHILFELCHAGCPPDFAVTVSRYPPRPSEDERIAPMVASAVGVRHVLLEQTTSRFATEFRKNWETHLCADEHAWYLSMVDQLTGTVQTAYDGLGGALSVPNRFLSRESLDLFEAGRLTELAGRLLRSFARLDESFLVRAVHPRFRQELSFDAAVARFAEELSRHGSAADPIKSFNFWNRIRRELALTPYCLMRGVPTVYSPYLDYDLYDFLASLGPEIMSPTLAASDKSFHTEAVLRGYPRYAHIPFEDRAAPKRDARAIDADFAARVAKHLLPKRSGRGHVLNHAYTWPRLLYALVSRTYRESSSWLPALALYLFQLDALTQRKHHAIDLA